MKIAVTSTGPNIDSQVEARFGRSPYFIIVDTEANKFEAIENPNVALGGGAGIQSAQLMAGQDVKYILTGNCGPNAFRTFGAAGVQVIVGINGTVSNAVEKFIAGEYSTANSPNVGSHFGMGDTMSTGNQVMTEKTIETENMPLTSNSKNTQKSKSISKEDLKKLEERAIELEKQIRRLKSQINDIR